jgi:hypothetical protein
MPMWQAELGIARLARAPSWRTFDERAQDIEQGQKLLLEVSRKSNLFAVEMQNIVGQSAQTVESRLRCGAR